MVCKTRKRSRTIIEDERADCPFELHISSFPVARIEKNEKPSRNKSKPVKKNKNVNTSEEMTLFQPTLFEPTGKFRSEARMGVYYHVEPRKAWTSMTRYHSFILNNEKYLSDEFVSVANDNCITRGKLGEDLNAQVGPCNVWVAQILEIRALDERHVYARVCWMYSPDELPAGRRPYYGKNEIIASNHLDVINVLSIVHRVLRCRTPAHPDKMLVGCTNSDCGEWMHIDCLREDVLKRVHDRLGADKPHIPVVKEMNSTDTYLSIERLSAKPPLNAVTMEDGLPTDIISAQAKTSTGVLVKCREESDSRSAERSTPVISQTARHSKRLPGKKTTASENNAFAQRYNKTECAWCLDWKQMGKQCRMPTGRRDWTKEEMMAYLDWDKAEEDRIEATVAAEMEGNRFSKRRGMREIWKAAAADCEAQAVLYKTLKETRAETLVASSRCDGPRHRGRDTHVQRLPTQLTPWSSLGSGQSPNPSHDDLKLIHNMPERTDFKPLKVVQPPGASSTVTDNSLVEWQKWGFRISFTPRECALLHDIHYDNRSVVHRLSFNERTVTYCDPRPPKHRKQAFDFGDASASRAVNNPGLRCDYLRAIQYSDATLAAMAKYLISRLAIRTSLPGSTGTISFEESPVLPDRDKLAAVRLVSIPELVVEPASTCVGEMD
ncbi:Bromo adjacent region [Akanthomyces lecanii RCEF 1005]|uniref:Amine oxidase n=1 Tax=Akanthomyces lecanii RCEF 1005 TaxID=1081108 RepID=A0A167SDI4_CORDF|nr:Bromo adjacent region [Akanthomyces lecanii RCEF 1005]